MEYIYIKQKFNKLYSRYERSNFILNILKSYNKVMFLDTPDINNYKIEHGSTSIFLTTSTRKKLTLPYLSTVLRFFRTKLLQIRWLLYNKPLRPKTFMPLVRLYKQNFTLKPKPTLCLPLSEVPSSFLSFLNCTSPELLTSLSLADFPYSSTFFCLSSSLPFYNLVGTKHS